MGSRTSEEVLECSGHPSTEIENFSYSDDYNVSSMCSTTSGRLRELKKVISKSGRGCLQERSLMRTINYSVGETIQTVFHNAGHN